MVLNLNIRAKANKKKKRQSRFFFLFIFALQLKKRNDCAQCAYNYNAAFHQRVFCPQLFNCHTVQHGEYTDRGCEDRKGEIESNHPFSRKVFLFSYAQKADNDRDKPYTLYREIYKRRIPQS